jgi:rhomboid family GlyGly-CTERM serine protease
VTKLQRLLSFHSATAVFPVVLIAVLLAVHGLGAGALPVLRYERSAVLAGDAWRLVTGHLVHADVVHLGWNVLGVLIVAFLFARDFSWRQWLVILVASTATTDLGFLLLEPQLEWYVGFSGVLHGLMAAGLVAWLRTSRDAITWIVTGLFAAKLAWEHFAGPLPFTAASLAVPVVHEAHTYGAIGGGLAGLWLTRRAPRPASL